MKPLTDEEFFAIVNHLLAITYRYADTSEIALSTLGKAILTAAAHFNAHMVASNDEPSCTEQDEAIASLTEQYHQVLRARLDFYESHPPGEQRQP
ncbi:hypothetical protein GCM10023116_04560 [Kistimonas scapharcae]|uniref:DUF3144 domain-containing protein n=1 Tax=Kistimonas scapharcae TaxID=1036133 RepID=A0ABP8UYL8_9GAMM